MNIKKEWIGNPPTWMTTCVLCDDYIDSPSDVMMVGGASSRRVAHAECNGKGERCFYRDSFGRRCTLERNNHSVGDDGRRHPYEG